MMFIGSQQSAGGTQYYTQACIEDPLLGMLKSIMSENAFDMRRRRVPTRDVKWAFGGAQFLLSAAEVADLKPLVESLCVVGLKDMFPESACLLMMVQQTMLPRQSYSDAALLAPSTHYQCSSALYAQFGAVHTVLLVLDRPRIVRVRSIDTGEHGLLLLQPCHAHALHGRWEQSEWPLPRSSKSLENSVYICHVALSPAGLMALAARHRVDSVLSNSSACVLLAAAREVPASTTGALLWPEEQAVCGVCSVCGDTAIALFGITEQRCLMCADMSAEALSLRTGI